jgi:hypothetical protein
MLVGKFNNATFDGFGNTKASCKSFSRLPAANHYGLINFV